jgi:hypothetical protein
MTIVTRMSSDSPSPVILHRAAPAAGTPERARSREEQ